MGRGWWDQLEQAAWSGLPCIMIRAFLALYRSFAFTHLNAHSSRSHAVVMLTVLRSRKHLAEKEKEEAKDKDGVVSQKVGEGVNTCLRPWARLP